MPRDPYKYFRVEAREILDGLLVGALALQGGARPADRLPELLRPLHTLKGAARVVRVSGIAELAHELEERLGPFRNQPEPLPPDDVAALLTALDRMREELETLGAPLEPAGAESAGAAAPRAEPPPERAASAPVEAVRTRVADATTPPALAITFHGDTVRASVPEVDAIMRAADSAAGGLAQAESATRSLHAARAVLRALPRDDATARIVERLEHDLLRAERELTESLEQAQHDLTDARRGMRELRMVDTAALVAVLERTVRAASDATGRPCRIQVDGTDTRCEVHVLVALRDALGHVARNAVMHGLEDGGERAAAGKPAAGTVHVTFKRSGQRIVATCSDDGRGLDLEALRTVAARRRLVVPSAAADLTEADLVQLVLDGGLSTSATVTELAGRGEGMGAAAGALARVRGQIELSTRQGQGTVVTLSAPAELSSFRALAVAAAPGQRAWLPLDQVERTLTLEPADVTSGPGGLAIEHDGRVVPLASLAALLGWTGDPRAASGAHSGQYWWDDAVAGGPDAARPALRARSGPAPDRRTAVVVRAHGRFAALTVERVERVDEVLMRPLPVAAPPVPLVAGLCLGGHGQLEPVLDGRGLIEAAAGAPAPAIAAPRARPVALVVDDSLTTRMLEQSILETAGFEVDAAGSAEDALEAAGKRGYQLFVVDVEMPGMDGFGFVERVRATPALAHVPAILVTSLSSPEHRERGRRAGASAYVTKGEFEETRFLDIVRSLVTV